VTEVLISGAYGLIGTALSRELVLKGWSVRKLDLRLPANHPDHGDVRNQQLMNRLAEEVDAIIHLAAVSRVQWGEADPDLCWQTNVVGTENVVHAAAASGRKPIVVMASSREIYGEPEVLPVREDSPAAPINHYGRSKAAGERATLAVRDAGVNSAIIRFSNVYGSAADHVDRVVPAFARAASRGAPMRVCGREQMFDFVHVEDSAAGAILVLESMLAGERCPPPIHFTTGQATTLEQLADIANRAGGGRSIVLDAPPRTNDVATFVGDPGRAEHLLGWRATIAIEDGVRQLVDDFTTVELAPLDFAMTEHAGFPRAAMAAFPR
jgi:nucleoside-diphosphate-sugar epimerase